ncbi:hypothetical protein BJ878DRAFT_37983 [Calycina marina]|uniref:Integral membrane protein n=1 Tax=Calycina marina TaxID=1763456 RepID=A0A9P7Z3S4_9HELO|nr:hypothetical protein BJ878DRAFT_37983 [Calycina marina]
MSYPHFTGRPHEECTAFGPFKFLNPTAKHYPVATRKQPQTQNHGLQRDDIEEDSTEQTCSKHKTKGEDVQGKWRSRDNRKGRHTLAVTPYQNAIHTYVAPPKTNSFREIAKGMGRMFTQYPVWDVSYLVAVIYTIGSIVWCFNAFFVWLPLERPSTEFTGEISDAGGWTAWIGATIFEFGSILLMIEAVNENRSDCFGWALEESLEEKGMMRVLPGHCSHHHGNRRNLVGKGKLVNGRDADRKDKPHSKSARTWTWLPSWYELRTHYFKEIGFLACLSQMVGATVFWIAGFTAIPGIYNQLTTTAAQNGAFWAPQVIGGSGFIISGILFTLETQEKWYKPAFGVLGWHIGMWNLIGGIGFTLCGALGFAATNSGAVYEGSLATFWGSWCFLIGSVIQWYESLDKHPVEVKVENSSA